MSNLRVILGCFLIVSLSLACSKDDDGAATINLDGPNQSGPVLEAGEYEAAVFFPANLMSEHAGKEITQIRYFMGNTPAAATLVVYENGADDLPGNELYTVDVTNSIVERDWSVHEPARSLLVSGEGVWVSVAFRHDIEMQSIGCDAGPTRDGGDWLYQSNDNEWSPYSVRTPESINWNIRLRVEE